MKTFGISVIAGLAALLASALQAHACRCNVTADPLQSFSEADVVVFGSVWKIDGSLTSDAGQTVTFLSQVTWKREPATKIRFVNRTTCAIDLNENERYLLFLHKLPETGELAANKCYGSLSGQAAEDAVRMLEKKAAERGPSSSQFAGRRNRRCGPQLIRNSCGASPAQNAALAQ